MSTATHVVLRASACLLFLWFGMQQLLHPSVWVAFLPEWTGYFPIPGEMLVQWNGWFEVIGAALLGIGFGTRLLSALLGSHLLFIALSVGGATGVRDAALAAMTLSLVLSPPDRFTLDQYEPFTKKKTEALN